MRFRIKHTTTYQYSQAVFLEPHVIRLRPQSQGIQQVDAFGIEITPTPCELTDVVDAAGNTVVECWFEDLTPTLVIRTDTTVVTHRPNPFDYLLHPAATSLPMNYTANLNPLLQPYRTPIPTDEQVIAFARDLAERIADLQQ